MRFYLGTHKPHWLRLADRPLFVSRRTLAALKTPPVAAVPWALDSGGFTELALFGAWTLTAADYTREVARYADAVGRLEWAAPQDYMCEPMIRERTGLTIEEHQRRTVDNLLDLRSLSDLPFVPVLQGWERDDYLRHVEMYAAAGIDLEAEALVGVGSVCRRQNTAEALDILGSLAPLRLHGFGFKMEGLRRGAHLLASADSLAWSYRARRDEPLPGCRHKHCSNCIRFAQAWVARLEAAIAAPKQTRFIL